MEDVCTDLLVTKLGETPVSSPQEARLFTERNLGSFVDLSTALIASGAVMRIALKLMVHALGKPAPKDGQLAKLVRSVKLSERNTTVYVHLYHNGEVPQVCFVIPEVDPKDSFSKRSLELLATLACYGLGVDIDNVLFTTNKECGTEVRLDSSVIKMLEDLIASASSPSGAYSGNVFKCGEYSGNLPTVLASIHLLNKKQKFLRSRTPRKNEKVTCVTLSELRNLFNSRTGLNDKSSSYSIRVVKQLLNTIVSVSNRRFPGGWIKSNRVLNGVKTDTGLISKLGYCEKSPYNHKLQQVIFNDTAVKPDGHRAIRSLFDEKEHKELSFKEFRLGCVLTCPRLDPSSDVPFDRQIKVDPLAVKNHKIIETFGDSKYHKSIDALNRAHALLVTVPKSTSKTKSINYEIARNELLHISAHAPIKDLNGKSYEKLSDIPKPVYDYCAKLYRFQRGTKRTVTEAEAPDSGKDSAMQIDMPEKTSSKVRQPSLERHGALKKQRTTGKVVPPKK